jgi:hypothetical protein
VIVLIRCCRVVGLGGVALVMHGHFLSKLDSGV